MKYTIREIEVESEVVKDETHDSYRGIVIRSSCASTRWGVRTQDYSYSCPAISELIPSFEHARAHAADNLVRTELGEVLEKGVSLLGAQLVGPTGQAMTAACAVNLSFSPTLLQPELIKLLQLTPSNEAYFNTNTGDRAPIPLYRGTIKFGDLSVETNFLPATYNGPVVLGGDFFQKALRGNEGLIIELIVPDHLRTLANAARCKKKYVLILGSYGDKRDRLARIKAALGKTGLVGLILDEYPDIEEQTLTEKMVTYAAFCRFVIVDDIAPSGHIKELDICHDLKFISAVLRMQGRPATAMQADVADEVSFIKEFSYEDDASLERAIIDAATWADRAVMERSKSLNRKYSAWRSPTQLMG
jgi:hypothetical protein